MSWSDCSRRRRIAIDRAGVLKDHHGRPKPVVSFETMVLLTIDTFSASSSDTPAPPNPRRFVRDDLS